MSLEAFVNGQKAKTKEVNGATVRLDLKLANPTDEATNEFSYAELVRKETAPEPAEPVKDPLDPFGDENEDAKLAAIAKRMEEKYGSQKKIKRVVYEQDLIDIGEGYDSTDSFVDDSEVYEDYVPPSVDTMYGGFYINTGELEFRKSDNVKDMEVQSDEKITKPKIKKQPTHCTPKALANKRLKLAKQHSAQKTKNMSKLSSLKTMPKSLLTEYSHSMPIVGANLQIFSSDEGPSTTASGGDGASASESEAKESQPPPVLPLDLPQHITQKIQQLEESIVRDQTGDGKLSYKARNSYDPILVDIESSCKNLPLKTRMAVFEYLAFKLGMNRSSLSNRIKRTLKKKEAGSLEIPLQQLKEAIAAVMPDQITKYEVEMKLYGSLSSLSAEESSTLLDTEDSTCTDEVFEVPGGSSGSNKPKRPRKKFQFTPEIKSLLNEVVRLKVEMELVNKNRTHSGEDIITKFLDTHVKPLWPKGWIQRRTLYKMTESVHRKFTNPSKASKKITIKKEKGLIVKKEAGTELVYEGSTQASLSSILPYIASDSPSPLALHAKTTSSEPILSTVPPSQITSILNPILSKKQTTPPKASTIKSNQTTPINQSLAGSLNTTPNNSLVITNPQGAFPNSGSNALSQLDLHAKLKAHMLNKASNQSTSGTSKLKLKPKSSSKLKGTTPQIKLVNPLSSCHQTLHGTSVSVIQTNTTNKSSGIIQPSSAGTYTSSMQLPKGAAVKQEQGTSLRQTGGVAIKGPTKVIKPSGNTSGLLSLSKEEIEAIIRQIPGLSPNQPVQLLLTSSTPVTPTKKVTFTTSPVQPVSTLSSLTPTSPSVFQLPQYTSNTQSTQPNQGALPFVSPRVTTGLAQVLNEHCYTSTVPMPTIAQSETITISSVQPEINILPPSSSVIQGTPTIMTANLQNTMLREKKGEQ